MRIDLEPLMPEIRDLICGAIVERAKDLCPVYTGFMKASIDWNPIGRDQGTIFVGAPYAHFIEYGTYKIKIGTIESPMPSPTRFRIGFRPFLRPAVYQIKANASQLATVYVLRAKGMAISKRTSLGNLKTERVRD